MALSQDLDLDSYRQAIEAGVRPRHVLLDLSDQTGGAVVTAHGVRLTLVDQLCGQLVGDPSNWWVARQALRRSGGGYIHANNEMIGFALLLLQGLSRRRSARIGFWVQSPHGRRVRPWFRLIRLLRLEMVLVAESERKAADVRRAAGPSARVIVPGEPIDLTFFRPAPGPSAPAPGRRPLVVSAGLERRDYRTLARAMEDLDVDVEICAASPNARTTSAALPDQLPANMRFVDLAMADLRDLYQRADVVVVPTVPNNIDAGYSVVMEAMACGRPVVASAQGQYLDLADAGVLRVAPVGSPHELRRIITELLDDPAAAAALGRAARADAEANHTDVRWMQAILDTVRSSGVAAPTMAGAVAD